MATGPVSQDILDAAKRMRLDGATWKRIGEELGDTVDRIRRRLDPDFANRKRASLMRARDLRRDYVRDHSFIDVTGGNGHRLKPDEAARALATVPPDTRDFTARAFGDPLPGRSALDKRTCVQRTVIETGHESLPYIGNRYSTDSEAVV